MAFSKQDQYEQPDQLASAFARALIHPARLRILSKLHETGPLTVSEIAEDHPIHKETISEHLRILREAELVSWDESFPRTYYKLHAVNMEKAIGVLKKYLGKFMSE